MKNEESLKLKSHRQAGQTLFETMVAAMVLVMGIAAAVALAVFSIGASSTVSKQLIAVGMAREAIEVIKNMRDTNWLQANLSNTCYDFYEQANNGAFCYQEWLNNSGGYNIDPGASLVGNYILQLDNNPLQEKSWILTNVTNNPMYGMDYYKASAAGNDDIRTGLYKPTEGPVSSSSTKMGRKITITKQTNMLAFNKSTGPRLKVRVDVWWADKRCPVSEDVPTGSACVVTLETYLTNWKDY